AEQRGEAAHVVVLVCPALVAGAAVPADRGGAGLRQPAAVELLDHGRRGLVGLLADAGEQRQTQPDSPSHRRDDITAMAKGPLRNNLSAGHRTAPRWLCCSSVEYARYTPSSRLALAAQLGTQRTGYF